MYRESSFFSPGGIEAEKDDYPGGGDFSGRDTTAGENSPSLNARTMGKVMGIT